MATYFAATECVERCEVLRGADPVEVLKVVDGHGGETGWVVLAESRGQTPLESQPLRDLGASNQEYLIALRKCVGRTSCAQCPLKQYTQQAYKDRGEI